MIGTVIFQVAKAISVRRSTFYIITKLLQLLSPHHEIHLRNTSHYSLVTEQSESESESARGGGDDDDRARRYSYWQLRSRKIETETPASDVEGSGSSLSAEIMYTSYLSRGSSQFVVKQLD